MGFLASLFGLKDFSKAETDVVENVIAYTKSLVVREDLIENILRKYRETQGKDNEMKITLYIQVYLSLEKFIDENKPLVIQRAITKQELRQEILNRVLISNLPERFRLIFLSEKEQYLYLFEIYTQDLAKYIINQTGPNRVKEIMADMTQLAFPTLTVTSNTLDFSILRGNLDKVTIEDLITYFKRLATSLFKEIDNAYGTKTAIDITEKNFSLIKESYDYDLISKYLTIIPQGILDRERIAYMTREDLEKQAISVVGEHVRRELAEKAARDLRRAVDDRTKELKTEKDALKRNEAKLLASIRSLPLGFILTDNSDSILAINEAAGKILNLNGEVKHLQDISTQMKDLLDFTDEVNKGKHEKQRNEIKELEFSNKILDITITPIFLQETEDAYIGTVILLNDITGTKILERSKDEFFAIASHDLRTPLTAIRGYVSLIQTFHAKDITNQEVMQMLTNIDISSQHLIEIVNDFLDVSRLEQGRIRFNPKPFKISELIKEVITEFGSLADKKQIYLRYENPDILFRDVYADREKTKQIISNLAGNAIKFTDSGGVTLAVEEKDTVVNIRVTDTGKGISVKDQNLLFKKFQQVGDNLYSKESRSGSGLGLYISKLLAQNMNGDITLESSEENKGSTFTISFPIAPAQQQLTANQQSTTML